MYVVVCCCLFLFSVAAVRFVVAAVDVFVAVVFFFSRPFEMALIVYTRLLLAVCFCFFLLLFLFVSLGFRPASVPQEAMIQECVRAGFLKRNNLSGLILMDCARLEKVRSIGTALNLPDISRRLLLLVGLTLFRPQFRLGDKPIVI